MPKTATQKAIELKNWETNVSQVMQIIPNPNFTYTNLNNKYYRLTDHIKCWMQGLFGFQLDEEGYFVNIDEGALTDEQREWSKLSRDFLTGLQANWWQVALSGKPDEKFPLPTLSQDATEEQKAQMKEMVYEKFFPVYRALKESNEKRWWFEWIFNRRQCTAERDALKVVKNLMLSATGDSVEVFNDKYEAYKVEVYTSNIMEMNRAEQVRVKMHAAALKGQEESLREQAIEDLKKIQEEQKKEEMEEVMQKAADELSTRDQFMICTQDNAFKMKVTEDLKAALAGKGNPALLKLMANSHVYNPLINEAEKFCKEFDLAVENGLGKADLTKVVNNGVKNVFAVALNATKNLKVADVKDRIIVAQKLTDIILSGASPVAFKQNEYGAFGKGMMVLQNSDAIREMLSFEVAPDAIDTAISDAKKSFGDLYPENKVKDVEQINVDLNEPNAEIAPRVDKVVVEISTPKLDK